VAAYTVINGTEAQLSNVDGSSTNVDALTYKNGITLDNTHLATLLDGSTFGKGVAAMHDLTGVAYADQLKRVVAVSGLYAST